MSTAEESANLSDKLAHLGAVPPAQAQAAAQKGRQTALADQERARKILRLLGKTYPYAVAELDFASPYQLLVATVLSAQTTDVRVNSVTPTLFAAYPEPQDLAQAQPQELEKIIKPLGFYRTKTRNIIQLAQELLIRHDGLVPSSLAELTALSGVGRKTAFVVLGNAFDQPGITVDTHVKRLALRLQWTTSKDPVTIERDLEQLFLPKDWTLLSHRLIYHGRRICHARKPACGACPIAHLCPSYGSGETEPDKAEKLLKYELAPGREDLHKRLLQGASRAQLRQEGWNLGA